MDWKVRWIGRAGWRGGFTGRLKWQEGIGCLVTGTLVTQLERMTMLETGCIESGIATQGSNSTGSHGQPILYEIPLPRARCGVVGKGHQI